MYLADSLRLITLSPGGDEYQPKSRLAWRQLLDGCNGYMQAADSSDSLRLSNQPHLRITVNIVSFDFTAFGATYSLLQSVLPLEQQLKSMAD